MGVTVLQGDCREALTTLPAESVQCCVTSPPYFQLRDYKVAGQMGMEQSPESYVSALVDVCREIWRVLRPDGTLWLNIGDSYARQAGDDSTKATDSGEIKTGRTGRSSDLFKQGNNRPPSGLKPKDLMLIPFRLALALQSDGWWVRSDIVWCLSGGTHVYARTQKGDMPMMLRDAARLDPATVKLWNGERWTRVLGWSRTARDIEPLEIVLRSGERISSTANHKFPTQRGLIQVGDLQVGDRLTRVLLPEPENPKDSAHIGVEAAWLAGLYLAEGSRSGSAFQISGHIREEERWESVKRIVSSYGGTVTRTVSGNSMDIRIYGRVVHAVIDHFICGKTAKDKGLSAVVWRYSNAVLRSLLDGWLSGDGHWDSPNKRWRLGFTRNYALERDLRTLSARLGFHLVLKLSAATCNGQSFPSFRGELRFERSGHWNEAQTHEVAEIRRARCREVYDVGVEDDPHLFALASGILTHNSKPNPMPESVTDRPTRAHEYIFLLSKSERYYYDAAAIREPAKDVSIARRTRQDLREKDGWSDAYFGNPPTGLSRIDKQRGHGRRHDGFNDRWDQMTKEEQQSLGANKRDVWNVATHPYSDAHFAVFPEALIEPCILAGSKVGDTILDPFAGSGTTLRVATKHRRNAIGIELNPAYCDLIEKRTSRVQQTLPMEEAV